MDTGFKLFKQHTGKNVTFLFNLNVTKQLENINGDFDQSEEIAGRCKWNLTRTALASIFTKTRDSI